jgi:hypothetical protein
LDELEKMFAEVAPDPTPLRKLRCDENSESPEEEEKGPGKKKQKPVSFDPSDLVDTKDIFDKFNEKWCNGVLELEKW